MMTRRYLLTLLLFVWFATGAEHVGQTGGAQPPVYTPPCGVPYVDPSTPRTVEESRTSFEEWLKGGDKYRVAPLRDVMWVDVRVASLDYEAAKEAEVKEADLRTPVESALRRMGLKVGFGEDVLSTLPDEGWGGDISEFRVKLSGAHSAEGDMENDFAFYLSLGVSRQCTIRAINCSAPAEVWEDGTVFIGPSERIRAQAMEALSGLLQSFENDWLKANPKE
jgi:hypothetical protein